MGTDKLVFEEELRGATGSDTVHMLDQKWRHRKSRDLSPYSFPRIFPYFFPICFSPYFFFRTFFSVLFSRTFFLVVVQNVGWGVLYDLRVL
jgi:hypothetical protein